MVASGIAPAVAMLISIVVFAGASMVAAAQLLASNTPALLVVLTTLFINLRFMMYSASLRLHFGREPLGWRLLMALTVATYEQRSTPLSSQSAGVVRTTCNGLRNPYSNPIGIITPAEKSAEKR